MNVRTSITLSEKEVQQVDAGLAPGRTRAEFFSRTIQERLRADRRIERYRKDTAISARLAMDPDFQQEKKSLWSTERPGGTR